MPTVGMAGQRGQRGGFYGTKVRLAPRGRVFGENPV